MTSYNYAISSDFPNAKVATSRLADEIGTSDIVTALDHVEVDGDDCDVFFKAALSSGDETVLDTLVGAHSGEPVAEPEDMRRADGRLVVDPVSWAPEDRLYLCGRGDDIDGGLRGKGPLFEIESTETGDTSLTTQFIDDVVLKGGKAFCEGGKLTDNVDFEAMADATVVSSNPGAGNCNLSPIGGGANIIVPAVGDGDYDVTLSNAIPIPAKNSNGEPNGYWNRDSSGNPTAAPVAGKGRYNLFDFGLVLTRHVAGVPLLSGGILVLGDNQAKPSAILRQWKLRCTMHHVSDSSSIKLRWTLTCGRKKTT